jgi:hypothetical protein
MFENSENSSELLFLLQKIAEMESNHYAINWDNWEDNVIGTDLERKVDITISSIEQQLETVNLDAEDSYSEETFKLCEALIEAYTARNLFHRKKNIETFLSTI